MPQFTPEFIAAHKLIDGHTLVDGERCFDLWNLLPQAYKAPGDIVEVGVWRGGTGCLIAQRAKQLRATEPGPGGRVVFLCDTFKGVVKAGEQDRFYHGGEHADTSIGIVHALFDKIKLHNYVILHGTFPEDVAASFDFLFCFAHIDVDVYQSTMDAFNFIWDRMPPGGIVVIDDYQWPETPGVTIAVDEICQRRNVVMVPMAQFHAVLIKTAA